MDRSYWNHVFMEHNMDDNIQFEGKTIYTFGHSNHALEKFLSLVKSNNITVVADIRSRPYSRFASQFNKPAIEGALRAEGIEYIYLGDKLGGRPDDKRFYDDEGNAVYSRISGTPEFLEGIERVLHMSKEHRPALMCSEEDPLKCHRFHMVSGFLEKRGAMVIHIRGDGRLQSGGDFALEKAENKKDNKQFSLFQK
jgi:uncharacterized protein (DUF488 family)